MARRFFPCLGLLFTLDTTAVMAAESAPPAAHKVTLAGSAVTLPSAARTIREQTGIEVDVSALDPSAKITPSVKDADFWNAVSQLADTSAVDLLTATCCGFLSRRGACRGARFAPQRPGPQSGRGRRGHRAREIANSAAGTVMGRRPAAQICPAARSQPGPLRARLKAPGALCFRGPYRPWLGWASGGIA